MIRDNSYLIQTSWPKDWYSIVLEYPQTRYTVKPFSHYHHVCHFVTWEDLEIEACTFASVLNELLPVHETHGAIMPTFYCLFIVRFLISVAWCSSLSLRLF